MTTGKTPTTHTRGSSRAPRITIRWLLRGGKAELGLTLAQSHVLMYLIDRSDKDGVSFPSQVRMAKELEMARSGVQKSLDHLQSIGAIDVIAKIKGRSNGYRVSTVPALSVGTPPAHSQGTRPALSTGQVVDNPPALSVGTKYLDVTEPGLPDLARSGAARPSDSQALRAADDDEDHESVETPPSRDGDDRDGQDHGHRARRPRQGASRAGNEAAGASPSLEPRQTTGGRGEATTVRAGWPTAVPGERTEPAA